jgi:hypothetical protein
MAAHIEQNRRDDCIGNVSRFVTSLTTASRNVANMAARTASQRNTTPRPSYATSYNRLALQICAQCVMLPARGEIRAEPARSERNRRGGCAQIRYACAHRRTWPETCYAGDTRAHTRLETLVHVTQAGVSQSIMRKNVFDENCKNK